MIHWCATYAWTQVPTADDDTVTAAFLLTIFVVAPIIAIRGYYRLKVAVVPTPKAKRAFGAIAAAMPLLLLALASAKKQGLRLWPRSLPSAGQWLVGFLFLVVMFFWLRYSWRVRPRQNIEQARLLLPENLDQLKYWILVSLMAGIGEEYIYRGVAYQAVLSLTGTAYSASLICGVAFGAAHLYYGLRSGLCIFVFGVMLQLAVLWTGALYLAIFVHTAYDLLVGIIAVHYIKKLAPQFPEVSTS